jgi:hypothetical protein
MSDAIPNLDELKERGLKVTHSEDDIHKRVDIDYDDINFAEVVSLKAYEYYKKYGFNPDIIFFGWATYLACIAWMVNNLGEEEKINYPRIFGLNALVFDQEHGLDLGFSDNGKSAQMYSTIAPQLDEGTLDD